MFTNRTKIVGLGQGFLPKLYLTMRPLEMILAVQILGSRSRHIPIFFIRASNVTPKTIVPTPRGSQPLPKYHYQPLHTIFRRPPTLPRPPPATKKILEHSQKLFQDPHGTPVTI